MIDLISLYENFDASRRFTNCSTASVRDSGEFVTTIRDPQLPVRTGASDSYSVSDKARHEAWKEAHVSYLLKSIGFVAGAGSVAATGGGTLPALAVGLFTGSFAPTNASELRQYFGSSLLMGGIAGPTNPSIGKEVFSKIRIVVERIMRSEGKIDENLITELFTLIRKTGENGATRNLGQRLLDNLRDATNGNNALTVEFNANYSQGRAFSPSLSSHLGTAIRSARGARVISLIDSSQSQPPRKSYHPLAPKAEPTLAKGDVQIWASELNHLKPADITLCSAYFGEVYQVTASKLASNLGSTRNTLTSPSLKTKEAVAAQVTHIRRVAEILAPRLRILNRFEQEGIAVPSDIRPSFQANLAYFDIDHRRWNVIGDYVARKISLKDTMDSLDGAASLQVRTKQWRSAQKIDSVAMIYRYEQLRAWIKSGSKNPREATKLKALQRWMSTSRSYGIKELMSDLFSH